MKKWIIIAVALFSAFNQIAASPINIIEVANFYCPYCYEAEQYIKPLRQAVNAQGGQFDFVPIYYGSISPWPARIYLSLAKSSTSAARHALFSAAALNGLPMATAQAACDVVNQSRPMPVPLSDCVNAAIGQRPALRLHAVLTLLKHIYPKSHQTLLFPVFVLMQDDHIKAVLSRQEYPHVRDLIREVRRALD